MQKIWKEFFCAAAIVLTAVWCLSGTLRDVEMNKMRSLGASEASAIWGYITEQEEIEKGEKDPSAVEYIGEIMGEKISKAAFVMRYALLQSEIGEATAGLKDAVWDSFKRDVWNVSFNHRKGIAPQSVEIDVYTADIRSEIEKDPKTEMRMRAYVEGLGMTWDEYWEYFRKYEAPRNVNHWKVTEFLSKVSMPYANLSILDASITDMDYYDSLPS